jgi:hypothetical protein
MRDCSRPAKGDYDVALLWGFGAATAVASCLVVLLLFLMQPEKYPNPGLAAYTPPPGTRLLPLPRKSDAPELAELPPSPQEESPLHALAQVRPPEGEVKEVKHARPARKRSRTASRPREQREAGYARPQWNGWRNDWNANSWNGGSGSWF